MENLHVQVARPKTNTHIPKSFRHSGDFSVIIDDLWQHLHAKAKHIFKIYSTVAGKHAAMFT